MLPLQRIFLMAGLLVGGLAGCGSTAPDNGAQQSSRVGQGVVIGVRGVAARFPARLAVGGTGSQVPHADVDGTVFEYIVRKANNDLVSVTQADKTPLALWQNVRVIAGSRARVVPEYAALAGTGSIRPGMRPTDAPGEETLPAALQP